MDAWKAALEAAAATLDAVDDALARGDWEAGAVAWVPPAPPSVPPTDADRARLEALLARTVEAQRRLGEAMGAASAEIERGRRKRTAATSYAAH